MWLLFGFCMKIQWASQEFCDPRRDGWNIHTKSDTRGKHQECCLSWRFLKIFFSERNQPTSLVSSETSELQCAFNLSQLCELPQHLGPWNSFFLFVFGFHTQGPSQWFDRGTLALRNYEELLGFLFCSSAGVSCLSLFPGLSQFRFSPELQFSAAGWTDWFHLGPYEKEEWSSLVMLFVLSILQVLEENGSGAGLLVITMQSELELFCKREGNWEGADCIDGSGSLYQNVLSAHAQFRFSRRQLQDEETAYVLNLPAALSPPVSQTVVAITPP